MPLFPEIDLPQFVGSAGENSAGALPPGDPVGVMAGLNASLLALLANFSPGDLGVCVVDEKLQLTLPVPEWARWQHASVSSMASIEAGGSTARGIETVPNDERWWLEYVRVNRASGDNLATNLLLKLPVGYFTDNFEFILIALTSDAVEVYWPDATGEQTADYRVPPCDLILEPGTIVQLLPSGAGVSATVFDYQLLVKRTKLTRTRPPN